MANQVSADQLVEAARNIESTEFSRDDLAEKLSVQKSDLGDAMKQARQDGRIEKVREDETGSGVFALTG